ncbi:Alpha-glucosidase [Minicystis rosea]|nr:Alpha-glucosidase [Minicystis rosea]
MIWPGDLDASFVKNGALKDDNKTSVGGLPASLVAGLSLGPSGFPFYGADTGGYLHSPPDKELFVRWFEQTALSTVMQIGNSASTVAWEPDAETGFDAEMLDWYRTYTRLHLRLFPYQWSYAKALAKDGRPIARPLGLAYPDLGEHPNDVYLFGDHLLVAPVVEPGVTSRSVPMPPGRWVDWWTGAIVEGGKPFMADAPLSKLPLWLAEGGIVPMLRPTIDTLRPVADPTLVDSYASDPGVLWARIAPGAASSFTVFDGAVITQERASDRVKLTSKDGTELKKGVLFEVVAMGKKPSQVTDGGTPLEEAASLAALETSTSGFAWSSDLGGTVYVKTPSGAHTVEIVP